MKYLFPFALSSDCGDDFTHCITPTNMTGKIYYSGIMVGETNGYSVGPIIGTIEDPSTITSFPPDDLYNFDFDAQTSNTGQISCCEGTTYPDDDDAIAVRIESYFAYVDVTFELSTDDGIDEALDGSHTIRTVYGDVDDSEYTKGDLLYKVADDDFRWCTIASGCTHTTRPTSPLQDSTVTSYSGSEDGLGNQTIPTFSANLTSASQIQLTESDILNNAYTFTIDYQMGDGVVFTSDLTDETTLAGMVSIFRLAAEPGSESNGFTASLTAATE